VSLTATVANTTTAGTLIPFLSEITVANESLAGASATASVCSGATCPAAPPECVIDADCGVGEVCVSGDCVNGPNGACTNAANSSYICSPAGDDITPTLTSCALCEAFGFGCPTDCSGDLIVGNTPQAVCIASILLLGGDGGACTSGLSADCMDCYGTMDACGSTFCASSCDNLIAGAPDGPNGCTCRQCVYDTCDAEFRVCAGYSFGRPNGTLSGTGGLIGGPPACEAIPTPACDE
jgi:hypothetical protein